MARIGAPCLLVALLGTPLAADTTTASAAGPTQAQFPEWPHDSSVYLAASHTDSLPANDREPDAEPQVGHVTPHPASTTQLPTSTPAAQHGALTTNHRSDRYLAPPADEKASRPDRPGHSQPVTPPGMRLGAPLETAYSTAMALAIVIGLFLLCAWMLRRGSRRTTTLLPTEVVAVLGRVPLSAKQFAELLRVGNKLVLVSITSTGSEPLTEVTDPAEVDRLLGLCQQYDTRSTSKAFEDIFRQLSRDPLPEPLVAQETRRPAAGQADGVYYPTHGGEVRRG